MKTCPACGGTGGRVVRSLSGWREEDWWQSCPECESRGVVEEARAEEGTKGGPVLPRDA